MSETKMQRNCSASPPKTLTGNSLIHVVKHTDCVEEARSSPITPQNQELLTTESVPFAVDSGPGCSIHHKYVSLFLYIYDPLDRMVEHITQEPTMATNPRLIATLAALLVAATPLVASQELSRAEYIKEYVDTHNTYRAEVGQEPLTWDEKLAAYATGYSQKQSAKNCEFEHSEGPYGENLVLAPDATWKPKRVVDLLASEKKDYDSNTNKCKDGEVCGHYTQIVWKDTKRVGCGTAKCSNTEQMFITCSYEPPGNVVGEHPFKGGETAPA